MGDHKLLNMKFGVFVALLCFYDLLAAAQDMPDMPEFKHDCVLVMEGEINKIMVPGAENVIIPEGRSDIYKRYGERYLYFHSLNEDGTRSTDRTERLSYVWYSQQIGIWTYKTLYTARSSDMGLEDNCPTRPFPIYNQFDIPVATVSVAKAPLNTLCKGQRGIIANAKHELLLTRTATSLYDCAERSFAFGLRANAVQYDLGVCRAFFGSVAEVDLRIMLSETNDSLACVFQCHPIPFMVTAKDVVEWTPTDFETCLGNGTTQKAQTVSYNSQTRTCYIANNEKIGKTILLDDNLMSCYVPDIRNPAVYTSEIDTGALTAAELAIETGEMPERFRPSTELFNNVIEDEENVITPSEQGDGGDTRSSDYYAVPDVEAGDDVDDVEAGEFDNSAVAGQTTSGAQVDDSPTTTTKKSEKGGLSGSEVAVITGAVVGAFGGLSGLFGLIIVLIRKHQERMAWRQPLACSIQEL